MVDVIYFTRRFVRIRIDDLVPNKCDLGPKFIEARGLFVPISGLIVAVLQIRRYTLSGKMVATFRCTILNVQFGIEMFVHKGTKVCR